MSSSATESLLVTGATGCVGSHVCLRAQALGLPVRGLVRLSSEADWLRRVEIPVATADLANADLANADLASLDSLAEAVDGVTRVAHCAARLGIGSPLDYRRLHVEGLRRLLAALARQGSVRQFVLLSSLGVHALRDHHGTDETVSPAERGLGACLETLVEAEQLALDWGVTQGVAVTVLRPGLIYGPRERWVLPLLLRRLREQSFRFLGGGTQQLSNTGVDNLVTALFAALDAPHAAGQIYHITDDPVVTQLEFIGTICELAGYPEPRAALPLAWARLAPRLPRWLRPNDDADETATELRLLGWNRGFSIAKARRELGYQPAVPFAEGMRQTIDWYRTQGLL
jgi:nucleoside-diphosphate-sugar epimerase